MPVLLCCFSHVSRRSRSFRGPRRRARRSTTSRSRIISARSIRSATCATSRPSSSCSSAPSARWQSSTARGWPKWNAEYRDEGRCVRRHRFQSAGFAARDRPLCSRAQDRLPDAEGRDAATSPTSSARRARPKRSCSTRTASVLYRGRIDDRVRRRLSQRPATSGTIWRARSMKSSPANRSSTPSTEPVGCLIGRAKQNARTAKSPTPSTSPPSSTSIASAAIARDRSHRSRSPRTTTSPPGPRRCAK